MPPGNWKTRRRFLLWGAVFCLLAVPGSEAARVVLGSNFHEVVPGRIFRCAQPSPERLETLVRRHGIRTVINLRGTCSTLDWYLAECRATHCLGINQEDIGLSAYRMPSVHEVRKLVEVLDGAEYPVLLHCRRGADRTGLAAAVCLLLLSDIPLPQARRQLGLRYGHVAVNHTACLDEFFNLYEQWLEQNGKEHDSNHFRGWIAQGYSAGPCSCRIEPLQVPDRIRRGEPWMVRLRFHNTSGQPWRFSPTNTVGIHGTWLLTDPGKSQQLGKAGLFDATIMPGQVVDLTLDLPAQSHPGVRYLTVDMRDERHCWFFQGGSEPWQCRVLID
jgi:protein tyrosine phosphatase (PTP) superfamily phosphohydrolase (DUF442 family)